MAYPSVISTLANPSPSDKLNNPSHSTLHDNENTAITEIQTFVGTLPASAVGTLMYDVRSPDSDGGGHVQSANKGGTGQTSYNKGDVLVGQSSSVLTKLSVGTNGQYLVADSSTAIGVRWGVGNAPVTRVYSSPSVATWVRPSNLSYVTIEIVGPGAGSSGGVSNSGGGAGSGGGGAGGYGKATINAASILASQTLVVPAGGSPGSVGGVTFFGSVLAASSGNPPNTGTGGGGGSVFGADISIPGGPGITAGGGNGDSPGSGGNGGSSFYGGGGQGGLADGGSGTGGSVPGSGAGGGAGHDTSIGGSPGSGASGAPGMIIITEY